MLIRFLAIACLWLAATAAYPADLTLTGTLTRADHETYREVPFDVPAGVRRITVAFDYTGREQKAVIDIGLRDPQRFRGWSGGNKSSFTVSATDATPSYLVGPLPAGEWRLVLGVPNLRAGQTAHYTATISFERDATFTGFSDAPLKSGPGWYRGDLHLHTGHSDASCVSRRGKKAPCPVFKTLEAAAARGLDFIAVTDHNTTSQNGSLRELAPYFDDLLLIPGREITTFQGHANVFGPVADIDFQLGSKRAPDVAAIQRQVERAGGVLSINHPGLPSGEPCMGCGWTAKGVDYSRVQAVEVANGGALAQARGGDLFSGVPFWEARLNEGRRITAVGGSDNHDPTKPLAEAQSVGAPTTVVKASALSQAAILAGIRAGEVFVDVQGTRDRLLEVSATAGGRTVQMGGALVAPVGTEVELKLHIVKAAGGSVFYAGPAVTIVTLDGKPLSDDETVTLTFKSKRVPDWIRVEVRGPDGKPWLIGNPIYLTPADATQARP